jgi:hypothetical protein
VFHSRAKTRGAYEFSSYGEVAAERQRDIIRELARAMEADPQFQEILKQLMQATQRTGAEWEKGTSAREGGLK